MIMHKFFAACAIIVCASCSHETGIVYAGHIMRDDDLNGQMRLAQNEVEVSIEGKEDKTAILMNTGNYFVMPADEVAFAVQSIKKLLLYIEAVKAVVPDKFQEVSVKFKELQKK